MNLIENNGSLYDTEGNEIKPLESGICMIGERRFVFDKLYSFILRKNGTGEIPKIKIKPKRGRPRKVPTVYVKKFRKPKINNDRKPKTNNHRKRRIVAKSLADGKQIVFESHTKAAEQLGISRGNISMAVAKKRPQAGGYVFERI